MSKRKKLFSDAKDDSKSRTTVGMGEKGNETDRLFNSAIGAAAIAASFDLGLFDELEKNSSVRLDEFCAKHRLHHGSMTAIVHVLRCSDIVEGDADQNVLRKGPVFSTAFRDKGYFFWLVCGYGNMLQNLSHVVRNEARTGDFIHRSGKNISAAARDYGSEFVDSYFTDLLNQVPFRVAADLGCGSAERLINLAKAQPDFVGVGIDTSREAVELARQSVDTARLQERITIIQGDVQKLGPQPEYSEVEVFFCFFMGHDLWPRANCLQTLRDFRSVFPRAKRFLLCDTYRSDLPPSHDIPIFTAGFELTHAVMGQYIPSVSEWMELFAEAGWSCVDRRDDGSPFSCIFDLRSEN